MFRKVLLTIGLLLIAQVAVFAQGTMKGTITDEKTGEGLIGANVVAKQGGQIIAGGRTDYNGDYTIKGLQVGKYEIEVSYMGYTTIKTEITVKASGFTVYNEKMTKSGAKQLKDVIVKTQKVPVIEIGTPETGQRLSAEDIGKTSGRGHFRIASASCGSKDALCSVFFPDLHQHTGCVHRPAAGAVIFKYTAVADHTQAW